MLSEMRIWSQANVYWMMTAIDFKRIGFRGLDFEGSFILTVMIWAIVKIHDVGESEDFGLTPKVGPG